MVGRPVAEVRPSLFLSKFLSGLKTKIWIIISRDVLEYFQYIFLFAAI